MDDFLQPVLVLLASSVLAVAVCRSLRLPPVVGYLATGLGLGPHAFALIADSAATRHLAEIGVAFLMFSIGLEFSLPKLRLMRREVFGLGAAQVGMTLVLGTLLAFMLGAGWQAGIVLGGAVAMSSTAIVMRLLSERMELDSAHGREIVGVLLFQDLAVVPLLILMPVLDRPHEELALAIGAALLKAAVVLAFVVLVGPRAMRAWFGVVARRRSTELFVLNVLLITLGLGALTEYAGLSLALGAFLAGMLISETEYRYQVEEDIKPFRDVLLGLFFVTVGTMLDPLQVLGSYGQVLLLLVLLIAGKFALIAPLSRLLGAEPATALRTAIALAQCGEFGIVLLVQTRGAALVPEAFQQSLLAAVIISMLAAPLLIAASDRIVLRVVRSEWMRRSVELHRVAVGSLDADRHVIILGYGRNGQRLARLLETEGVRYVALDLDPARVREAAAAGDTVVFADSSRREALIAAGIARAAAVVVTFADTLAAERVLAHIHALNPFVPAIVRAREERDIARLTAAGASEVVPEALESGLMLASHTLVWVGVPLARVMRRVRKVRDEHYELLRGLFHGESDAPDTEEARSRLHAVVLVPGAWAVGRDIAEIRLDTLGAEVRLVRRPSIGKLQAGEAGSLLAGDVVVMFGAPEVVVAAEERLLRG